MTDKLKHTPGPWSMNEYGKETTGTLSINGVPVVKTPNPGADEVVTLVRSMEFHDKATQLINKIEGE